MTKGIPMAKTERRERGSGPVTALLVLGALALVFAMGVTMVGTVAGDESSSAQHAADAAALALPARPVSGSIRPPATERCWSTASRAMNRCMISVEPSKTRLIRRSRRPCSAPTGRSPRAASEVAVS